MARLFSFRKRNAAKDQKDAGRSVRNGCNIRQLLSRAKNIFRSTSHVEPSPPLQPLTVPEAAGEIGALRNEIDRDLQLQSVRTTASDTDFSNLLPFEPATCTGGTTCDAEKTRNELSTSSTTLATAPDFGETGQSHSLSDRTDCDYERSSLIQDDDRAREATGHSASHPSPTGSSGESLSSSYEVEPPSVLDMVRRTWGNAHAHPRAGVGTATVEAKPTLTESTAEGSPLSSWIDRIIDPELRQDLMLARASMIRQVYENPPGPLIGLQLLAAPEENRSVSDRHCDPPKSPSRHVQVSTDFANAQFLENNSSNDSDSLGLSQLFAEAGYPQADESRALVTEMEEAASVDKEKAVFACVAQSQLEVEIARRNRVTESWAAALAEQRASLESEFEKELAGQRDKLEGLFEERYKNSEQLHEIDMLNLQDDHDAEVKELKQTAKGLRVRLVDRWKAVRALKVEVGCLQDQRSTTENQLQHMSIQYDRLLQAFHEREALLQSLTEELHELREEMAVFRRDHEKSLHVSPDQNSNFGCSHKELTDRCNGLVTEFNPRGSDRQDTDARFETMRGELEAAQAALAQQEQACEDLRIRHDHVVAEKVRDFSWHVAHGANPLSMKPMNTEDEISAATRQLRQKLEEEVALSADLRRLLEAAQATSKTRSKKQKRTIAKQSQEKVILEMALAIAQGQRDHWAEQYDEIAEAVTSKLAFSSFARGLAERHLALQETRFALEAQLLEAKLRGDRALLECAIRKRHESIKLEKRDAEIGSLELKLRIMKQKFEYENGMALLYKDVLDREVPGLRQRNSEVEQMLEDQVRNNAHADHQAVFDDLHRRIHELESTNRYWEEEMSSYLQEYGSLQTEWNIFASSIFCDLTNARAWRDERDRLDNENFAFRQRFADELVNEPLVIPTDRISSARLEDDFKLENIDDCLLKQYNFTWGAVPREVMDRDAPPWEYMKVDLGEDIREQKKRWIQKRDEISASFRGTEEDGDLPNNHEWIDSMADFESFWKGGWGKEVETGLDQVLGATSSPTAGPAAPEEEDPEAELTEYF